MPLSNVLHHERVELLEPLTAEEVAILRHSAFVQVVQCSAPLSRATLDLLNDELFAARPDIEFRAYGFYEECDLSFLRCLYNVQCLAVDCLLQAMGIEHVASLPQLRSLKVGIYDLESFDFLYAVPPSVERLSLAPTRSRKPDLTAVARFRGLKRLFLGGQKKSIAVIAGLRELEELVLSGISTPDVSYLDGLPLLRSLTIQLGGIRDLSALAHLPGLRNLDLIQVRGLSDLGVISHLAGLESLGLQSLPQVQAIPSLRNLRHLRTIGLQNLKGLKDLSELEWAPALERLCFFQGEQQRPEDLLPALRNPHLHFALGAFGSAAKDRRFSALLRQHGIEESAGPDA